MVFNKMPEEFTTNDVIAVLKAVRDDHGVTKRFDVRVRQVADRDDRKRDERQVQNVVRRMVKDWNAAINDKIFKLMSEEMDDFGLCLETSQVHER